MKINGVWLPIITPFINDEIDFKSYAKLIDYYIDKKISGIIPIGTTGEGSAIDDDEFIKLIENTIESVNNKVPIFFGVGGNYTKKVLNQIKKIEKYNFDGILSVSPYYNRPNQTGIYEHFKKISECTNKKIIIYNIPYRTGRNIENETIFKLSELKNIVGIKDSCGDIKQSMELIINKPNNFYILTGEDILFYTALTLGADGGILAAAHIETEKFIKIYELINENNHFEAKKYWKNLIKIIPLLFDEPNPAPIKYILKSKNMITSNETRLPITQISENLKKLLNEYI